MGRRSDTRPGVEILDGSDPHEPSAQVRVGSSGGRRRALAVLAAVVLLLALGGVLLDGGGDDDRTQDSERRQAEPDAAEREDDPTTTTALAQIAAPVFGEPAGASLLLGSQEGGWRLLDLDGGAIEEVPALDGTSADQLLPVQGGVLVADPADGGAPTLVALPGGAPEPLRFRVAEPRLALVTGMLASGTADHVWVVLDPANPVADAMPLAALVRLDGEVVREVELRRTPSLATMEGLVVSVGGRTYLHDEGGSRLMGVGTAHAASATEVAMLTCDDQAECAAAVLDVTSGAVREGMALPDATEHSVWMALSGDGALAALPASAADLRSLTAGPPALSLSVSGPSGATSTVDAPSLRSAPVWLPGDLGLAVLTGYGLVRYVDDGAGLVGHRVADLRTTGDDTLILIPRA